MNDLKTSFIAIAQNLALITAPAWADLIFQANQYYKTKETTQEQIITNDDPDQVIKESWRYPDWRDNQVTSADHTWVTSSNNTQLAI